MQRDFRKQYYSNIGVLHDDPKFRAALAEKVVNLPLLREMVLRLGLPMSCRAAVWRLLLLVAHPSSDTWPVVMGEFKSRYEDLQSCAKACQVWQSSVRPPGDKYLQAVNFALLQMLHAHLHRPLQAVPLAPIAANPVQAAPASPFRRHSGGASSYRVADKPPRVIEMEPRTEVALKANIARIFGEVFDEEDLAYFCFAGFLDFLQGDAPTWAAAIQALMADMYRLATDHCKEVWCTGTFYDLRLQQKDEMDLLLRDVLGSAFACHLERRHLLAIYDMLLCYSPAFIPFVAMGFLKVGWLTGPLRQCRTVLDVRRALSSRDLLNNQEVQKLALSRAKEWYLSSAVYSKSQAQSPSHAPAKPAVSFLRKKATVQYREPRLPETEVASIAAFRRGMSAMLLCKDPTRPGPPEVRPSG
eukprot:EG_transcript_11454